MAKPPFVQQTAPERIWLTVSDDAHDAGKCFPDDHAEICWSVDAPLDVCVPYVRADLVTSAPEASGADCAHPVAEIRDGGAWCRDCGQLQRKYLNPAPPTSDRTPADESGPVDSFVMVESAVRSLPPGYAFADAVEHATPAPPTSGPEGEDGPWASGWEERSRSVPDPFTNLSGSSTRFDLIVTTPADESGADYVLIGHPDYAADMVRALKYGDAEPRAAAQEGEADELLRNLGLDPQRFRTEAGYINHRKVSAALRHPDDYAGLCLPPGDATIERAMQAFYGRADWQNYRDVNPGGAWNRMKAALSAARLQPSGAGEDAARDAALKGKYRGRLSSVREYLTQRSQDENGLSVVRDQPEDDLLAQQEDAAREAIAARRARGESND